MNNAFASMMDQFDQMRNAYLREPMSDSKSRIAKLRLLEEALVSNASRLEQAMSDDFGHRSRTESSNFDITVTIGEIRHARRSVKKWMRSRYVMVPKHLVPARAKVMPQPIGVVGIISPWNFPVCLTLAPLAAALAAGNRVMIKPSELTAKTSELLKGILGTIFSPDEVYVELGGADIAAQFTTLPFAHLLFTGSTAVGHKVALAAAANLTPVTLELGGKSPAVITKSADLVHAAKRIAWGKTANAGQICIAPDYAMVPEDTLESFVQKIVASVQGLFPDGIGSDDYTSIISEQNFNRLHNLVDEARARGCRVVDILPPISADQANNRKFAPVIVVNPPADLTLMREEIFGPILPVITYADESNAQNFVNQRDRPLALYVFANEKKDQELWLMNTVSGGVTVNDVLMHFACDTLPFGGVGLSGMGAYHGVKGFETFSHLKPVFIQSRFNGAFLFQPPFTSLKIQALKLLRKII